jgi:peptidylprolyl isomerase
VRLQPVGILVLEEVAVEHVLGMPQRGPPQGVVRTERPQPAGAPLGVQQAERRALGLAQPVARLVAGMLAAVGRRVGTRGRLVVTVERAELQRRREVRNGDERGDCRKQDRGSAPFDHGRIMAGPAASRGPGGGAAHALPLASRGMTTTRPLLLLLLVPAFALAACGDDEAKTDPSTAAPTGGAQTTPAPAETEAAEPEGGDPKDLDKKPRVDIPEGAPPAKLVKEDIVKGKGTAAKKGDAVDMQYVGVLYDGGTEFDASWNSGKPFPFRLGAGDVIKGWDQGIVGMKEGGRRKLIIPPALAYGPQGQPPTIPPDATLVFVVDLVKIR